MPYNGSGLFTPAVTFTDGTPATAEDQNTQDNDIASGLSQAMTRAGLAPATASWSMGGFQLNELGAGVANGDAVNLGQVATNFPFMNLNADTINVNGAVATYRTIDFQTSGSNRFSFITDNTTESGSNAGSNFSLNCYADTGTLISEVFSVIRSTGRLNFNQTPTVAQTPICANGQCHFSAASSTVAVLSPKNGCFVQIAGTSYAIPSAGISASITNCYLNGVSGQTLSAGTLYYVYVWYNAGSLSLNFSTTGHSTDTTAGNVGVEIMTGNNAYTLVGMVYPQSGPVLAYSGANQLVLSWFNKNRLASRSALTANRTSASTTFPGSEFNAEIRCFYLVWAGNPVVVRAVGTMVTGEDQGGDIQILFDGTTVADVTAVANTNSVYSFVTFSPSLLFAGPYSGAYEGYHYATLFGWGSAGVEAIGSGTPGARTTLEVDVDG